MKIIIRCRKQTKRNASWEYTFFRHLSFTLPEEIEEFIGHVNSGTDEVSIARMKSPSGWSEPGQTPEFNEYTLVVKGVLHAASKTESWDIPAGHTFIARRGEWVQYSTPDPLGAECISVCVPAFSLQTVHRDPDELPHP